MDLSEVRRTDGQRHPWELARVRALGAILLQRRPRCESILDVGCGDGFLGESLRAMLHARVLVGIDAYLPAEACRVSAAADHVVERYQSDGNVGDRRFDLILALDVLEHAEDDRGLLMDVIAPRVAPGGHVLVTVPAFQSLFSEHDRALRHFRRYNLAQLKASLTGAGLHVIDGGYFFASLLAPRAISLLSERLGQHRTEHGAGSWHGPSWLGQLITGALTVDARLLLTLRRIGIRLPGLTAWAWCGVK